MSKNVLLSKHRKDAKREQAIKQVKEAYALCEVGYIEDDFGEKKEVRYLNIDGENYSWQIQMEPEMEDLYSTLDIVKALGIPRERLRDWITRDFVKPSLPAYGQGTIAIFTFVDVLAVKLLDRLIAKGFKRELATEISGALRDLKMESIMRNIIFVSAIRNGQSELVVRQNSGDGILQLEVDKDDKVSWFYGSLKGPIVEEWEDIQIFNLRGLYKEVEAELDKLG